MIQLRLQELPSFFGVDVSIREQLMGLELKYKGLVEPQEKRDYGGRKTRKEFLLPTGDLAVSIDFTDVKKDGETYVECILDEAGYIKKDVIYYNSDDSIYCEKIEYEVIKNKKKLKKSRITYSIDHLVNTAEQLGASTAVKSILSHYSSGFQEWKDLGDGATFINDLNNEPSTIDGNPNVMYYTIHAPIPGFEPKTFYDSLIEQLTSTKWVPTT